MKYEVIYHSIGEALKAIEDHKYSLPNIQRPYVWKRHQIEDLVRSIIEGYPMNLMTFMEVPRSSEKNGSLLENSFAFITEYIDYDYDRQGLVSEDWEYFGNFRSPKEEKNTEVDFLVFDGQQRLTSINIAFRGTHSRHIGGQGNRIDNPDKYIKEFLCVTTNEYSDLEFYWQELNEYNVNELEIQHRDKDKETTYLNLRAAYNYPTLKPEHVWKNQANAEIYTKIKNSLMGQGDLTSNPENNSVTSLMILKISEASLAEGFEAFLRINNSGTPVSKPDLVLAALGCHWSEAREEVEKLEMVLNSEVRYYIEQDHRSIILQGALIVGSRCKNVAIEVKDFKKDVSGNIKENWVNIKAAFEKSKLCIEEAKIAYTNRGFKLLCFYIFYKFPETNWNSYVKTLSRIHISWFTLQTTENAKLRDCVQYIYESETIDESLNKCLLRLGNLEVEAILDFQKEHKSTRKILQLIQSKVNHFDTNQYYDIDHLHSFAETDRYLSMCTEEGKASTIKNIRNTIVNLQLLDAHTNRGMKSSMELKSWLEEYDQDQKSKILPFNHKDLLDLDNCIEFWTLRREYVMSILKQILGDD